MNTEHKEYPELSGLFDAARAQSARPSEALMARVSEDAAEVQSGFRTRRVMPVKPGRMAQLFQVLGGWPAMGGLVMAAATGLWIGAFPPDSLSVGVSQAAQALLVGNDTAYLIDIAPGSEFDLGEEAL
jgi:hypothetical protein